MPIALTRYLLSQNERAQQPAVSQLDVLYTLLASLKLAIILNQQAQHNMILVPLFLPKGRGMLKRIMSMLKLATGATITCATFRPDLVKPGRKKADSFL
jgi:hypothetical protein